MNIAVHGSLSLKAPYVGRSTCVDGSGGLRDGEGFKGEEDGAHMPDGGDGTTEDALVHFEGVGEGYTDEATAGWGLQEGDMVGFEALADLHPV